MSPILPTDGGTCVRAGRANPFLRSQVLAGRSRRRYRAIALAWAYYTCCKWDTAVSVNLGQYRRVHCAIFAKKWATLEQVAMVAAVGLHQDMFLAARRVRVIMLSHALTIVIKDLNKHLSDVYKDGAIAELGNVAEGFSDNHGILARSKIYLSVVNIKEEKSLKNVPNYIRDDVALKARYENPPAFLNFQILVIANYINYTHSLTVLSRVIRFFQYKNVFTQDNVDPNFIKDDITFKPQDQLETFKLIFDFYSPTMEEVNHLWGTLGGKQYPFVLYTLRMLDLKFNATQSESGLITEVVSDFYHKNGVTT